MAGVVCVVSLETGERKKIVLPTGSYDELLPALSTLAPMNEQTLLQIYDDEVDEYIDLESDATIHPRSKIKVSRKIMPPTDSTTNECTQGCSRSSVNGSTQERQSADCTSATELVEVQLPLQKQFDYLDFKLPSFGPYEEVLQRREPVGGPVRRAVVNRLFQACFQIVWFPSKELYNTAVEQLIQKYPHLRDNVKKGSGMESWKLALKNKFKNSRKKSQNASPEMEAIRALSTPKRPRVPVADVVNKKLCRLSDNADLIVYGDTAEARQRHHQWLTQNATTAEDFELRPRLLATAKERHERLQRMTIPEALLQYPFLATEQSLLLDFNLVFKKDILYDIAQGFRSLCDIILRHGDQDEVTEFCASASEDRVLGVLSFIANRCNDPLEIILTDKAETSLTPCIQKATDGTLVLYADHQRLFVASSLLSAIASLFALFWVFHVKYPRKAERMMTFIEHAFVDLCHTKPKVKALELINFYKNFS